MNIYPNVLTPPLDSPDSNMLSPASGSNTPPHTMISQGISPPYNFSTHSVQPVHSNLRTPYIIIAEQPVDRFRFRYKSEMAGTHGSLNGKRSDRSRKQTFPCIKLENCEKPAILRCSLYQWGREEMAHTRQPHAHRLVKKHGSDELDDPHDIRVNKEIGYYANFHSMGIIHTAKKYIVPELTRKNKKLKEEDVARIEGKVRPLNKKEELEVKALADKESKSINLNIVCLRFDAFEEVNGIYYPLCPPVYSNAINNLKSALTGDLKIVRMDHCTSPSRGGREVFILVEKVTKKNIKVRFFELDDEDNEIWSDYGKFTELDVHHQYAIVFKTPAYKTLDIDRQVKVFIELQRPTDGTRSEPKDFTYTPCEIMHSRKRARNYSSYSSGSYYSSGEFPAVIPQVVNDNNFMELQPTNPVVNSSDLAEALKQNNIDSDEFQKICDQLMGSGIPNLYVTEQCDIGSREMQSLLTTDSPQSTVRESEAQTKSALKRVGFNDRMMFGKKLTQEELQIVNRVKDELISFIVASKNPSKPRVASMLESLLQTQKYISQNGNTALHLVILENSPRNKLLPVLLKILLKYQLTSFVNIENKQGQTPLHLAVESNNYVIVEHLMNTKADVSIQDEDGNTALHLSIIKNAQITIIKALLNVGSDVNKFIDLENYDGLTAIHLAVKMNNIPATKLLCWNNANINIEHKKNGYTPLHMAVADQHLEIVNFLLEGAGAQPDAEDYMQCNPLKLAKVLIQPSKPVTQKIYDSIENYMKRNGIYDELTIKEEVEDISEEEVEEIKAEPLEMEVEPSIIPSVDTISEDCLEQVCDILDKSGTWQNLAELLDYGHLLRTANVFTSMEKPSKSLINFALTNGDSLQQIRDFLEHLDEPKAVEIIDNMIKRENNQ